MDPGAQKLNRIFDGTEEFASNTEKNLFDFSRYGKSSTIPSDLYEANIDVSGFENSVPRSETLTSRGWDNSKVLQNLEQQEGLAMEVEEKRKLEVADMTGGQAAAELASITSSDGKIDDKLDRSGLLNPERVSAMMEEEKQAETDSQQEIASSERAANLANDETKEIFSAVSSSVLPNRPASNDNMERVQDELGALEGVEKETVASSNPLKSMNDRLDDQFTRRMLKTQKLYRVASDPNRVAASTFVSNPNIINAFLKQSKRLQGHQLPQSQMAINDHTKQVARFTSKRPFFVQTNHLNSELGNSRGRVPMFYHSSPYLSNGYLKQVNKIVQPDQTSILTYEKHPVESSPVAYTKHPTQFSYWQNDRFMPSLPNTPDSDNFEEQTVDGKIVRFNGFHPNQELHLETTNRMVEGRRVGVANMVVS